MKHLLYILLSFLPFSLFAQTITGIVLDEDGDPLPYASVYVRNNPISGTMTDLNGRYILDVDSTSALSDEVVFSFIGYRTEEFPIATIISDSNFVVTLVEQPIMLEGATVKAKISRKESTKLKREALEKFVNQMAKDFPERTAQYPIFSMYNGSQDARQLIHHEVVGTISEYPIDNKYGGDSVALVVKSVKEFTTEEAKIAYDKFNAITDDRLNSKKNKKKKVKLSYTKRDLDAQALRMHRFLWGGPTGSFIDMLNTNKPAKWDYTLIGDDAVLTYTEKENYMGIVKGELQLHFYIDPVTFQINKIAQSLSGELHIPFGYKLKDDELEFINALQFGHDTLDRYRVRHAYVDVLRNVLFRRTPDGNVVVREKNLEVCGDLIDTKKKKLTYSAEAKAIVSGAPKVIKKD